jgi:ribonuclease J
VSSDVENFSVVALGGLGEIGMNCLAVETNGRILLVDCGVMFSSEGIGVDLLHPSFQYLAQRRDDIEAVVLTHAHEDHISGVPFLLREVDVPIYGGSYALKLLKEKLSENRNSPKLVSFQIDEGNKVEIGPFEVTPFAMPHSIAQNTGLKIEMPQGTILHTGDFKLGLRAADEGKSTLDTLAKMAKGGIDLMLSDSTGSEETEVAGDESEVTESLERLVAEATGRVFVALFSSNVRRLESVLKVAQSNGRKVALIGRSVLTHSRVAAETCGLSFPAGLVVPIDEVASLPPQKTLLVVSGTQGEHRSALGRLASQNFRQIEINKGDLVILSSRFIPGNELAIGRLIDQVQRLGARVVHRGVDKTVHVSGHGSRSEITKAIHAVAPRTFMPVHGTYRHLVACEQLALEAGIKHTVIAANSDVVSISPDGMTVRRNRIPVRRICIDGGSGLAESAVKDRRILGAHGVLVVSFTVDDQGRATGPIDVIARGVTQDEALPWLADQIRSKVPELLHKLEAKERNDSTLAREFVRSGLRRFTSKLISREPYVLVSIL